MHWQSSSSANGSNRQVQKSEMMGQMNGSVASSNSSASSLTAFNFDDSGAGTDDQAASLVGFENGNFYESPQIQQFSNFNTIYQQPFYPPHLSFSNENLLGNNNTALFKDLDGSKLDHMPICSGCQQAITERYILRVAPNLEFHASCLRCNDCQRVLDETCTVFLRNGRTYCKEDYARLFARKCAKCEQQFTADDMLMRARNMSYHLDCFVCATCNRKLSAGEQFVVNGNDLFCQAPECFRPKTEVQNWEPNSIVKSRTSMDGESRLTPLSLKAEPMDEMASSSMQPINYAVSSNMIVAPMHQSSLSSNSSASSISGRHSLNAGTSSGGRKSKKDKPTQRIRTVLTEQQLKILKHMYTINQRPDATTKETLVQQTGLSQRVIRVWFQNKRCKDKKKQTLAIEQEHNIEKEQAINGIRHTGIGPIVALSPSSLQESGILNAVEIRQFSQNPTLWSSAQCDTPNNNQAPLTDLSYSNAHPMMVPTSYPQEMTGLSPDYNQAIDYRYSVPASIGLGIPSCLPNTSLTSSPACSD
ncbi:Zinc finger and Homeobox domain containing protein [Aphelenchoides bicaudatus]|nr:Zinc finger and Homeobox domain containing protein [Aphelenchoides bicaudatus]